MRPEEAPVRSLPMSEPAQSSGTPTLVRAIGVRALTATIFNMIVGAGIFVLPAKVAGLAGPSAPLVFVVCGVVTVLVLTCFAMAGSRVALSGGPYAYIEFAFGPALGFMAGFMFWAQNVLSAAAVANVFLQSLSPWTGLVNQPIWRSVLLAGLLATLAAINIRGTRQGARLIEVSTVAKLVPLLILVLVGLVRMKPENLAHPEFSLNKDFGAAALLLFFAFGGGEMALQAGGEIKEPNRTVPRALLLGGFSITIFYLAIQVAVQGVFGDTLADHSQSPLVDAAAALMGPLGALLMVLGLTISVFGWLSGDMLNTPRTLFAFAKDGFLPRQLAWVHPRFRTPAAAIALHATFVLVLAGNARFEQLANLSSLLTLVVYLLGSLAAWRLDIRDVRTVGEPFRPPGARFLPWCAAAVVLWFIRQSTAQEFQLMVGVALFALGLFGLRQWTRRGRRE